MQNKESNLTKIFIAVLGLVGACIAAIAFYFGGDLAATRESIKATRTAEATVNEHSAEQEAATDVPTIEIPTDTPELLPEHESTMEVALVSPTAADTMAPTPTEAEAPVQISPPTPTNTSILAPYIKEHKTISPLGTEHVSLAAGDLIVGTADRFQEDVNAAAQPPCTAFLIRGPLEMDVTIWYGGWEYWENVYDDSLAETLLQQKVRQLQPPEHQTCANRGDIQIVRLP